MWFLDILDGREVHPLSGLDDRPVPQRPSPELDPHLPFQAEGLYEQGRHGPQPTIPWYAVLGNHDHWGSFERSNENYDIGTIDFDFHLLGSIYKNIPTPKIKSYGLNESKTLVLESSCEINAPLELVFNVLSDYSIRHHWSVGVHP